MKRIQLVVMSAFCLAVVIATGCDSQNSDLHDEYKDHVSAARSLVSDQMDGAGTSDEEYHSQMGVHLRGMEAAGEHMADQCAELTDCPMGGGATGDVVNGHMNAGHMLSAQEMNEMHDGEGMLRDEMDQFERNCIEVHSGTAADAGLVDCDEYRPEHFGHMYDLLDDHYQFCDEMMGNNGHMNGGGRRGGDMM